MDVFIRPITRAGFFERLEPANQEVALQMAAPYWRPDELSERIDALAARVRTGDGDLGYAVLLEHELVGWAVAHPEPEPEGRLTFGLLPGCDRAAILPEMLRMLRGTISYQGHFKRLLVRADAADTELLDALAKNGFAHSGSGDTGSDDYRVKL